MVRDRLTQARGVVLSLMVLLLLLLPACTRNSPTSPGDDPADTEEPLYTTTSLIEYYLAYFDGGLHCLGYHRDGGDDTIYGEPRLWLPREMALGDTILSAVFYPDHQRYLEVVEITDTVETPVGTFEGVINVIGGAYDWADFSLCPEVGFLDYIIGGGRAFRYYYLQSLSVVPGGDDDLDYFGLAPGNAWTFTSSGSDSEGLIRYEGVVTRVVEGPLTVGGRQALVLRCEETTSAYDISGLSSAGREGPALASRGISSAP